MTDPSPGMSRRALLLGAGASAAIAAAGSVAHARVLGSESNPQASYPFFGEHQQGILTPHQQHVRLTSMDVVTSSRSELIDLLRDWTTIAAAVTAGRSVGDFGAFGGPYSSAPEDTGEAIDLAPARLTITVGFGSGLFRNDEGFDRFGIASSQPEAFSAMPAFPGDDIDSARSGGDLLIQVCGDDPQVVLHATRNMVRATRSRAVIRWSDSGFHPTSKEGVARNLFGFHDGTANPHVSDSQVADRIVWVQEPTWMLGGTYLAFRRFRMMLEAWDRATLSEQERVFGRTKREGAPLSGGTLTSGLDVTALGSDGEPLIDVNAHAARANPGANEGRQILRRPFSYDAGTDSFGRIDAGQLFIAFTNDFTNTFLPIQQRLAGADLLLEYVRAIGGASFAIPPGVPGPHSYFGEGLFT